MKYAKFTSIEAYNTVNRAIAAWKDIHTNGEYSRTGTEYEYNPEPEPEWDGMFYMTAKSEHIEAGLFEGVTIVDVLPVVEEVAMPL